MEYSSAEYSKINCKLGTPILQNLVNYIQSLDSMHENDVADIFIKFHRCDDGMKMQHAIISEIKKKYVDDKDLKEIYTESRYKHSMESLGTKPDDLNL
jgi:hypothetical protein